MKHSYTFYLLFLTIIIISSCDMIGQNHPTSETQRDVSLKETLWKLIHFQDENGRKSESGSSEITLIFHEDETLTGTSSSNTYASTYKILNDRIDIERGISTYVGEPVGSKYDQFSISLKRARSYKISDNKLLIYYGEKDKALIFEAIAMEE